MLSHAGRTKKKKERDKIKVRERKNATRDRKRGGGCVACEGCEVREEGGDGKDRRGGRILAGRFSFLDRSK